MFYVYLYLREDGSPYYVGKGKGNRVRVNGGRPCKRPSNPERIKIHTKNLTEDQAFSLEKKLIHRYGRKCDGGILHNKTFGGEGSSGWKAPSETRMRMSMAQTGKVRSAKARENYRKANTREKNPMWGKSYKKTPEQIAKSAKAKWKRCSVNGVEYKSVKEAAEAHSIKYDTAKRRCQKESFGWKYIKQKPPA